MGELMFTLIPDFLRVSHFVLDFYEIIKLIPDFVKYELR